MSKWIWVVGAVVIVLAVGAGAFYGGTVYERTRQANLQAQFFAERGGNPGGFTPPEGFTGQFPGGQSPSGAQGQMFRGTSGTVSSLNGDTLVLTTDQETTTIVLTDDTVVERTVEATRSDLQPGQSVTVMGQRDDQGNLTATTIQILPSQP